jgi:hypothetical protein
MKQFWVSGNWNFGGSMGSEIRFDPEVPIDVVLFYICSN